MTLDQSDVTELLEALRAGGGVDVVGAAGSACYRRWKPLAPARKGRTS